ncbi:membrane protein insertion efficiency factor YidD [Cellvibrio zantedeschiae]|uniref:membrane protein insertion efficiency factor YidD n=1 Tax=Cellvibrio zantedeschiae TaxID=1237077 RepID=UPI001E2F44CE|nr:membrane protein insertion efficiency factor YidD [Cellvibrio zantedeschiae]
MDNFNIDAMQLNVDEKLRPSLERKLTGTTRMDAAIGQLPIPKSPLPITMAVMLLRGYRKLRPKSIGNRCVFEPSCSHYSELAIRQNGLVKGVRLTAGRLLRCRPNAGGLDLSCQKEQSCNTK